MKSLNFNNVKKQYLTVTLADAKETTIMIGTPTKAIMDDLTSLQTNLTEMEGEPTTEAMGELYRVSARLMSRNKGGIEISQELLEEIFDFEDIIIFFNAYMDFITEITDSKN